MNSQIRADKHKMIEQEAEEALLNLGEAARRSCEVDS